MIQLIILLVLIFTLHIGFRFFSSSFFFKLILLFFFFFIYLLFLFLFFMLFLFCIGNNFLVVRFAFYSLYFSLNLKRIFLSLTDRFNLFRLVNGFRNINSLFLNNFHWNKLIRTFLKYNLWRFLWRKQFQSCLSSFLPHISCLLFSSLILTPRFLIHWFQKIRNTSRFNL